MKQVLENPAKNQNETVSALTVIACILTTIYLASNIMAIKVINVGGISLFDAGTITFPFAYMLGDVLTEIWGFRNAKKVIILTFFCNILLVLFTALGTVLPAPDYMEETNRAYQTVFTYVPRIIVASLVAFLCGELSNAWFLEHIKTKTGEKHLWLRTIGSSCIGYFLDTVLFVVIAFWGTCPLADILSMIWIQYIGKLGIEALCGTPMAYAIVAWWKRRLSYKG